MVEDDFGTLGSGADRGTAPRPGAPAGEPWAQYQPPPPALSANGQEGRPGPTTGPLPQPSGGGSKSLLIGAIVVASLVIVAATALIVILLGRSSGDDAIQATGSNEQETSTAGDSAGTGAAKTVDDPRSGADQPDGSAGVTSQAPPSPSSPTPTPTPVPIAVVATNASFTRKAANLRCTGEIVSYIPANLFDGDENTGWGASKDDGTGQWIDADFGGPVQLTSISITPGYTRVGPRQDQDCRAVPAFNFNRILTSVTYTFDDGSTEVQHLEATPSLQTIDLDTPVTTSRVRITINGTVRPPGADADTVISEASFAGIR